MSTKGLVAGLPLVAGSALISLSVLRLVFSEGFFLEWVGAFLVFYGLSYLMGTRSTMPIAGVVLVAGVLGDMVLVGGLRPLDWVVVNFIVFIHASLGTFAGRMMSDFASGKA